MKITLLDPKGIPQSEKFAFNRLEDSLPDSWQAYGSYNMIQGTEKKDIDLIIISEDRLIVVELKNWYGEVVIQNNSWIQLINGSVYKDHGDIVKKAADKVRILASKVERKLKQEFTYTPWIESCIVMCGKAKYDNFPEDILATVFSLKEFEKIGKKIHFKKCFPKHAFVKKFPPNSKIKLWNGFFLKNSQDFIPRPFTHNGYRQHGEAFFVHKNKIYSEYVANQEQYRAILRRWDWSADEISKEAKTEKDRMLFFKRESKVLSYIDSQDENDDASSLSELHLEYIPTQSNFVEAELYKWPKNQERLSNFPITNLLGWDSQRRIDHIKVFISHLARLHQIGVAHRDIGGHSVWLSNKSIKVKFSNFVASTYPEDHDRKFIRSSRGKLLHLKTPTPEDLYDDEDGTPFTRDVYFAASVAHFLAFSKWPKKKEEVYFWSPIKDDQYNGSLNAWFKKSLEFNPKDRFDNLIKALDFLNESTIKDQAMSSDLLEELLKYSIETNPWILYAHNQKEDSGNSSLLYKSDEGYGLKIWSGVNTSNTDSSVNFELLAFLDYIQSLTETNTAVIPEVKEFGYNDTLKCLFIAYQWIDGLTWTEYVDQQSSESEVVAELSLNLLKSLQLLHKNKIFHGNIHADNIVCQETAEAVHPKFVDLFDRYSVDSELHDDGHYSAGNNLELSIDTRDRLAVVKIISEAAATANLESLQEKCLDLLIDEVFSEGDFQYLIDHFQEITYPPPAEELEKFVICSRHFERQPIELASDDGTYYIGVYSKDPPPGKERQLTVSIIGIKQRIKFSLSLNNYKIQHITNPSPIQHSDFMFHKNRSEIELRGKIQLIHDSEFIADEFIQTILDNNRTKEIVAAISTPLEIIERAPVIRPQLSAPISSIWKTFVDTEYSTYPTLNLMNFPTREGKNIFSVRFSIENGNLDFDLSKGSIERVKILRIIENRDRPTICGIVLKIDIQPGKSVGEITYKVKTDNRLEEGNKVVLESNLVASSLNKRKRAIEDIINERSAIPNLAQYFDPNEKCSPSEKTTEQTTDEELDKYTENGFELNKSQRESFKKLYCSGPLGLLQGPPGTGKTTFIGAFIHYSILKGAKRVLLVSQSHEAVNGAAETVRKIFDKKNQNVSIVRFGDFNNISMPLEDVHEMALQDHYRELFRAEIKLRIKHASESLNFEDEFIDLSIEFELSFSRSVKAFLSISNDIESQYTENEKQEETLKTHKQRESALITKLSNFLSEKLGYKESLESEKLTDINDMFYELMSDKFSIDSPSRIVRLRHIINLSLEWIGVMSSSKSKFQNFLAKTRTVVCGTCVGIGRQHYGIDENIYDLVVIDEAARATSSELAIAMRLGEKVILVGDHKQLLPFIEPEHLKEIKRKLPNISEYELKRSDFERSFLSQYGKEVGQRLSTQYRMAPPIGRLVSDCFYEGMIKTDRPPADKLFEKLNNNLGSVVTWLDTSDQGQQAYEKKPTGRDSNEYSFENECEADLIINLIHQLVLEPHLTDYFESKEGAPQIGVICMYKEQLNLLNRKLLTHSWLRNLVNNGVVKIDTVDSYQGKENPIIITSLVRNNAGEIIGFLKEETRANVALSRAKERLYIIGSKNMWAKKNSDITFGKVLSYLQNNASPDYKIIDSKILEGENEEAH